jgi:hypothetical protein
MKITADDIRECRALANNIEDTKRVMPYVDEVEQIYVAPRLGAKVFKEISDYDGSGDAELSLLWSGGYYDNDTRVFAGLKKAYCYLAYSRFIRNQSVNVTAFGVVQKTGQFSEAIDSKTTLAMARDAESIGMDYLENCLKYLIFVKKIETAKSNYKRKFLAI